MNILSVYDEAFRPYGRVVEGYPVEGILKALAETPCTDAVVYEPRIEALHQAPHAEEIGAALYGGMPFQFGFCNGVNTKLNCLEFHRDSEFNLGTEDFILLIAKQEEIIDGKLDTSKVKAFKAPAGVLVECYATTLHYAPCHADPAKGFRVLGGKKVQMVKNICSLLVFPIIEIIVCSLVLEINIIALQHLVVHGGARYLHQCNSCQEYKITFTHPLSF